MLTGIEVILMASPACVGETKEKVVNDQSQVKQLASKPVNDWNNCVIHTKLEPSKIALGYRKLLEKGVQISEQLLADHLGQPLNQGA